MSRAACPMERSWLSRSSIRSSRATTEGGRLRFEREREVAKTLGHPGVRARLRERRHRGRRALPRDGAPARTVVRALRQRTGGAGSCRSSREARTGRARILALPCTGIIHRAPKPANAFLLTSGEVKLLDFGFPLDAARSGPITGVAVAMGTPAFMLPSRRSPAATRSIRAPTLSVGAMSSRCSPGSPFTTHRNPLVAAARSRHLVSGTGADRNPVRSRP